jgi:hypothetical protein
MRFMHLAAPADAGVRHWYGDTPHLLWLCTCFLTCHGPACCVRCLTQVMVLPRACFFLLACLDPTVYHRSALLPQNSPVVCKPCLLSLQVLVLARQWRGTQLQCDLPQRLRYLYCAMTPATWCVLPAAGAGLQDHPMWRVPTTCTTICS